MKHQPDWRVLEGPVYPIAPVFKREPGFPLNLEAIDRYVRFLVKEGARVIMTTVGTSRFHLLTDDEIRTFNETVVRAAGNAVTIVANPMVGDTVRAIGFAKHAEEIGANAIMLYYPERYYSDEDVVAYFKAVAETVSIGVFVHGMPIRNASAKGAASIPYGVELMEKLATIPNLVGSKEESGNTELLRELGKRLGDRLYLIPAGGSMSMYLTCYDTGIRSYLVGIANFVPKIEEDFYELLKAGKKAEAEKIIAEQEAPFFAAAKEMGWHKAMMATQELMGLTPSVERPPMPEATPTERAALEEVIARVGWQKQNGAAE